MTASPVINLPAQLINMVPLRGCWSLSLLICPQPAEPSQWATEAALLSGEWRERRKEECQNVSKLPPDLWAQVILTPPQSQ